MIWSRVITEMNFREHNEYISKCDTIDSKSSSETKSNFGDNLSNSFKASDDENFNERSTLNDCNSEESIDNINACMARMNISSHIDQYDPVIEDFKIVVNLCDD